MLSYNIHFLNPGNFITVTERAFSDHNGSMLLWWRKRVTNPSNGIQSSILSYDLQTAGMIVSLPSRVVLLYKMTKQENSGILTTGGLLKWTLLKVAHTKAITEFSQLPFFLHWQATSPQFILFLLILRFMCPCTIHVKETRGLATHTKEEEEEEERESKGGHSFNTDLHIRCELEYMWAL